MSLHGTKVEAMLEKDRQEGNFRLKSVGIFNSELWLMEKPMDDIFPFFGYCVTRMESSGYKVAHIYIAKELPLRVRNHIFEHEFYHFKTVTGGTWKSELKAVAYAFRKEFLGGLQNIWWTIKTGRLKPYIADLNSRS